MALTPQQVSEKKFTSTRFKNGYDETEVDAFLDEVEAELTRLNGEAAALRAERASAAPTPVVPVAPAVPAPSPSPGDDLKPTQGEIEEMLRRTLLLGQRAADEAVAEAKAEAEQLRSSARAAAETLRIESEQQASDRERAASMRATVAIAEHEAARRRIEEQIADLHSFEVDFRNRLRAYLELSLNDLNGAVLIPSDEVTAAPADRPASIDLARFSAGGVAVADAVPADARSAEVSMRGEHATAEAEGAAAAVEEARADEITGSAATTGASGPEFGSGAGVMWSLDDDPAEPPAAPVSPLAAPVSPPAATPVSPFPAAPASPSPAAAAVAPAAPMSPPPAVVPASQPMPVDLPELPPLPSWMSSDAAFDPQDPSSSAGLQPQPPEGT